MKSFFLGSLPNIFTELSIKYNGNWAIYSFFTLPPINSWKEGKRVGAEEEGRQKREEEQHVHNPDCWHRIYCLGIFEILSESSRIFKNLPDSFVVFWNVPESSRIFQDLLESFRIFWHLPDSSRILQNYTESCCKIRPTWKYFLGILQTIVESWKKFQNLPESFRILQNFRQSWCKILPL